GLESTVLDLSGRPRLLRPGLIAPAALEAVIGPVERPAAVAGDGSAALPSPGMLARHYAPRTPLEAGEGGGLARVAELRAGGLRVALVSREAPEVPEGVVVARLPGDPAGYAAALYAALHELDGRGLDRIVVALPPAREEWLAARDRLLRAAT